MSGMCRCSKIMRYLSENDTQNFSRDLKYDRGFSFSSCRHPRVSAKFAAFNMAAGPGLEPGFSRSERDVTTIRPPRKRLC